MISHYLMEGESLQIILCNESITTTWKTLTESKSIWCDIGKVDFIQQNYFYWYN